MKKLFIFGLSLIGLSLAFQTQTQAQTEDVRFGITAGANMMKMGRLEFLGTEYRTKYKPGFQAGVYMDLPLGNGIALMPEVLFSQKGGKVDETVNGTRGELESTLSYIDVPVLIGFKPSPDWSIFVGPQASFLVDTRTEIRVNGEQQGDDITDKENMRKSIAGGVVGLGYQLTPNVKINGRYIMDFQSVTNDNIEQDEVKNSGFALSLGYTF
jgi:hypothetical protein